MSGSVNKVILVGRVGKDPETKTFANGGGVTSFSVATSETWKDKTTGERKEKTEWHNIVIFNEHIAKVAGDYVRKGSTVYLEGSVQTRKYQDQTGADRYVTEIVLARFRGELALLDAPKPVSAAAADDYSDPAFARPAAASRRPATAAALADLDDDVPF